MNKKVIVGNWKMNKSLESIKSFFKELDQDLVHSKNEKWIAPQFIHIKDALELSSSFKIKIGAQNASSFDEGAHTGEISPKFLKELGCHFVILGHSERRSLYGETNEAINLKVLNAQKNKLLPIVCVGETLKEREENKTEEIILHQLALSLSGVDFKEDSLVIAYEPVWAIGTGKTATPKEAKAVHELIRNFLKEQSDEHGDKIAILYGGSVTPQNIKELFLEKNINGALVGGASLKPEDFSTLCKA